MEEADPIAPAAAAPRDPRSRGVWVILLIAVLLAGTLLPLAVVGKRALTLDRAKADWQATRETRTTQLDRELAAKRDELARLAATTAAQATAVDRELAARRAELARLTATTAAQAAAVDRELAARRDELARLTAAAEQATARLPTPGEAAALATQQAELQQLREALAAAHGELALLAQEKEALAANLTQLKEQPPPAPAPAPNAEALARADQAAKEAEDRLADARTEIAVLHERRNRLQDELAALNRSVLSKKAETADVSAESTLTLVSLRSEQARLLEAISLARQSQEELQVSVANLVRDKVGTEKELELLRREYERILAQARAATAAETENASRREHDQTAGDIAALRAEKATLGKAVADSQTAVDQLNQEITAKAEGVRNLRHQLNGVRERLTAQLELLVRVQQQQEERRGGATEKIAELEKKVLQTQIQSLEAERGLLLRDLRKLEERLRKAEHQQPAVPAAEGGSG